MEPKASVMFVCVHNAGRSQMAAAYLEHLGGADVEVRSSGTAPAESVNPAVVAVMLEEGIDISQNKPKLLTVDDVRDSDYVITMGCGDTCPIFPARNTSTGRCRIRLGKGRTQFVQFAMRLRSWWRVC